jgi:hypothetical protein
MSRDLDESMRMKRVQGAITQAQAQLESNDIPGAFKTIDGGLRLDPTNTSLNTLMNKVRPMFEKFEKSRVSTMDKKERMKEDGDTKFKNADFEGAIQSYTKCLDMVTDKVIYIYIFTYLMSFSFFVIT